VEVLSDFLGTRPEQTDIDDKDTKNYWTQINIDEHRF
jgi:hypothetical protein